MLPTPIYLVKLLLLGMYTQETPSHSPLHHREIILIFKLRFACKSVDRRSKSRVFNQPLAQISLLFGFFHLTTQKSLCPCNYTDSPETTLSPEVDGDL